MAHTSKTGLMESVRKPILIENKDAVTLTCSSKRAPFILRPFAGLYNPFSYGCSILCNHPADAEIKDVVKRAKDALVIDGKNDVTMDELDTMHGTVQTSSCKIGGECSVDFVQEELFRRYTDTDSRPLTPAPTLASAVSRSSMKRRCLTPDHPPAPKQTLILDLRRSHSQETLYWHGYHTSDLSSGLGNNSEDTNLTTAANSVTMGKNKSNGQTPLVSPVALSKRLSNSKLNISDPKQKPCPKVLQTMKSFNNKNEMVQNDIENNDNDDIDENELLENMECEDDPLAVMDGGDFRRRGRRRKGRNRLMSAALIATNQNDPETQIAGIGSESHNPSSRASIVPNEDLDSDILGNVSDEKIANDYGGSFLEPELLEYLQREVDHLAIETEFDPKRRIVLQEAYRTRSEKVFGKEMQLITKELLLPPVSLNKWLHLPRVYSRRNAIFSLPIDRRQLDDLLPMQYVSEYIKVSSSKKLLYRVVLEKYENLFYLSLENISEALTIMMGETLDDDKLKNFKSLLKWDALSDEQLINLVEKSVLEMEDTKACDDCDEIDNANLEEEDLFAEFDVVDEPEEESVVNDRCIHFRTWCGMCALCERLYAALPNIKLDPPYEVEVADFDTLQGKLISEKIDENLIQILLAIQISHTNP